MQRASSFPIETADSASAKEKAMFHKINHTSRFYSDPEKEERKCTNRLVISSCELTSDTNIKRIQDHYTKIEEKARKAGKQELKKHSYIFTDIKTVEVISGYNKISSIYGKAEPKSKISGIALCSEDYNKTEKAIHCESDKTISSLAAQENRNKYTMKSTKSTPLQKRITIQKRTTKNKEVQKQKKDVTQCVSQEYHTTNTDNSFILPQSQ